MIEIFLSPAWKPYEILQAHKYSDLHNEVPVKWKICVRIVIQTLSV
jgi:hypothetical protein